MSTFSQVKENVLPVFFQKDSTVEILICDVLPQGLRSSAHTMTAKRIFSSGPSSNVSSKNTLNNAAKVTSASAYTIVPKQRTHLVMALRILASSPRARLRIVIHRIGKSHNDGILSWKARRMPFGLENIGQDKTQRRVRPDFALHCVLCFRGTQQGSEMQQAGATPAG